VNRIDRLTAILIHLQSKKIVKAEEIADRFEISIRTVYRDVKALMEAGVPIGSEAGTGYFIVDGYHLPPVIFNQEEAGALLMAGKLVERMTDPSVRKSFESALYKIKSVLNADERDSLETLQQSVEIVDWPRGASTDFPNNFLTDIQKAIVGQEVLSIDYHSGVHEVTHRELEPIGIHYYSGGWHLIGWCRLRSGYRDFRADRIKQLKPTGHHFDKRNLISLQEYLQTLVEANRDLLKAVVIFDKSIFRYRRYIYGHTSEEDLGDKVRMTFLMSNFDWLARWLLSFGNAVVIEEPESLQGQMLKLVEEVREHYLTVGAPTNR
jgi:predicted DNA-binding transcriptional regulator YafY